MKRRDSQFDMRQQIFAQLFIRFEQQIFRIAEIMPQQPMRHARLPANLTPGRAPRAEPGHARDRRIEQVFAPD